MNKYLYIIKNFKTKPWIKYWLLSKNGIKEIIEKITGIPPLILNNSDGKNLKDYRVYGNTVQNGEPTPDTPIEMVSCGDRSGNLFDVSRFSYIGEGSYSIDDTAVTMVGNSQANKYYLAWQEYEAGTYTFTFERETSVNCYYVIASDFSLRNCKFDDGYLSMNAQIATKFDKQYAGYKGTAKKSFTIVSDVPFYFAIAPTQSSYTISNIMLNKGSTSLPYEPYGYKIPVIVGSDNLATNLGFGWYSGINQKFTISYDFKRCTAKIKPNTTYTISKKNASNRFVVITSELEIAPNVSYKRVVLTEQNTNRTQYTFTTREDENYLFFGYYRGTDETEIELAEEEMMIVEGSTAPSKYIPYYNEITNIYLDEPLRKIGDYLDYIDFKNQKVFRNVIVNDDTGTQTIENSYTGTTDSSGTSISLPNIPTIKGTTVIEVDTTINPSNMEVDYVRR